MSIRIEFRKSDVDAVISALRNVEGKSEEAVFKKALNTTARRARRELAQKAQRIYAAPWSAGIYERSSVSTATTGRLSAIIHFKSEQPDITHFKYKPHNVTPTKILKSGKRKVWSVGAAQFRGGVKRLDKAFVIQVGEKQLVVYNGKRIKPQPPEQKAKRDRKDVAVKTVMGSSDMVMVRNEKVYGALSDSIGERLHAEMQKALAKALGG